MRGSLKRRYKGSWSIILELPPEPNPETGRLKRKQKWVTFRGTRKQAEKKLTELLGGVDHGTFVEPSKLTLGSWLETWLTAVTPHCRPATMTRYRGIVRNAMSLDALAAMLVQQIRTSHVQAYYMRVKGSASTVALHHTILLGAFKAAQVDRLVTANPVKDLPHAPKRAKSTVDELEHVWTPEEARTFLETAKAAGPQPAALYGLALDTGMRKGELCGLRWADVDLEGGKAHVRQQLTTPGPEPVFGPPKNGEPRTILLGGPSVVLLTAHKAAQAILKMKNRTTYHDFGLVFAKEYGDLRARRDLLGQPLQANNLGVRQFDRLIKVAKVRRIKFHGLRHTCATLLLRAGEPIHVVSKRLGHKRVEMTTNIYAHVLPDMQQGAADRLGALLHGG